MAKIAVIGVGYVGLTTAVGLANLGHEVVGIDVDAEKERVLISNQSDEWHLLFQCSSSHNVCSHKVA